MYKTISAGRITELQGLKANLGESQGASVLSTGLEINYTQAVTRLSLRLIYGPQYLSTV